MMTAQNELKISLPNDTDIVWERTFDAPRALVFEVMTSPEHRPHWMPANYGYTLESTAEVRPGGSYRDYFHINSGENFALYGEYREIDAPSRYVFTENMEGYDVAESVNVVTLEERDGCTYVHMVTTFETREQRDALLATGATEGGAASYDQMEAYLKTLA